MKEDDIHTFPMDFGKNNLEITLRDYFAGIALPLGLGVPAPRDTTREEDIARVAKRCYEIADAMLEARKQ